MVTRKKKSFIRHLAIGHRGMAGAFKSKRGLPQRAVNRKLRAAQKMSKSRNTPAPTGNVKVHHSIADHHKVIGNMEGQAYFSGGIDKRLSNKKLTEDAASKKPASSKNNTVGKRIYLGTTSKASKRTRNSMQYHEMGHLSGEQLSLKVVPRKDGSQKAKVNKKSDFKQRGYRNSKGGKRFSPGFTEEVRAWKNALDMTKGKGQKRRISPIVMRNGLKSYERAYNLPSGTADRQTKILLRYNRMKNMKGSKVKHRGSVATKNSQYMNNKRSKYKK